LCIVGSGKYGVCVVGVCRMWCAWGGLCGVWGVGCVECGFWVGVESVWYGGAIVRIQCVL